MKVIKAMKIAKRNKKAKDLYDRKTRGYTDEQYKHFEAYGDRGIFKQYLEFEDKFILSGKTLNDIDELF